MHVPVLPSEVVEYLAVQPNRNYVDATINGGGHTLAILEKNAPHGKVLGIDWDSEAIARLRHEIKDERLIVETGNFTDIAKIVENHHFGPVHGILFDLGLSSQQLEESGRGFSFQKNEPLDMRYNINQELTAGEIVNHWPEHEIERVLREYGEERSARAIAKKIVTARKASPIKTTNALVTLIQQAIPSIYRRRRLNPATKTFQALRITVNRELESITEVLPQALKVLASRGRLAVISFHSLEDRIVKNCFRIYHAAECATLLTKKPTTPSAEEIKQNPRARSAKLRALEKK